MFRALLSRRAAALASSATSCSPAAVREAAAARRLLRGPLPSSLWTHGWRHFSQTASTSASAAAGAASESTKKAAKGFLSSRLDKALVGLGCSALVGAWIYADPKGSYATFEASANAVFDALMYSPALHRGCQPDRVPLLPASDGAMAKRRTVVLDLEDTLIHTHFSVRDGWTMAKRPYVDQFLHQLYALGFEVVIFSERPQFELDQGIPPQLDKYGIVPPTHWLFREQTVYDHWHHHKPLKLLGRPLSTVILVEDSALSASYNKENTIRIPKFEGDADVVLRNLAGLFQILAEVDPSDVRQFLRHLRTDDAPAAAQASGSSAAAGKSSSSSSSSSEGVVEFNAPVMERLVELHKSVVQANSESAGAQAGAASAGETPAAASGFWSAVRSWFPSITAPRKHAPPQQQG